MQDQIQQQNIIKWSVIAKTSSLEIQYMDNVSYRGVLYENQFINLIQIKDYIQKGNAQIISKSNTKMKIKLFNIISLQLFNQHFLENQRLNKRINQLQSTIKQLNNQKWQEQNLNSTQPFNINYLYRIIYDNTYTVNCHFVDQNNIYHFWNSGSSMYNIGKGNRKSSTTGHTVNKIWKQLIK